MFCERFEKNREEEGLICVKLFANCSELPGSSILGMGGKTELRDDRVVLKQNCKSVVLIRGAVAH